MGQDQRRCGASVVTSRAETCKAEEEAQRRRKKGDQRSHQKALGTQAGGSYKDVRPEEEDVSQDIQQASKEDADRSRGSRNIHRSIDFEAANILANRGWHLTKCDLEHNVAVVEAMACFSVRGLPPSEPDTPLLRPLA